MGLCIQRPRASRAPSTQDTGASLWAAGTVVPSRVPRVEKVLSALWERPGSQLRAGGRAHGGSQVSPSRPLPGGLTTGTGRGALLSGVVSGVFTGFHQAGGLAPPGAAWAPGQMVANEVDPAGRWAGESRAVLPFWSCLGTHASLPPLWPCGPQAVRAAVFPDPPWQGFRPPHLHCDEVTWWWWPPPGAPAASSFRHAADTLRVSAEVSEPVLARLRQAGARVGPFDGGVCGEG